MSTQTSVRRLIDDKATMNIISKRGMIRLTDIGTTLRFHVQGNGNIIPAMKWVVGADGKRTDKQEQALSFDGVTPLMKRIYNIKANSQMAMQNPRNQALLADAMKLQADGREEEASDAFNAYLNATQVSFSYLLNPGVEKTFYDGQLVEGEVTRLDTPNGSTIVLENVRAVAITKVGNTPAFSLSDLLGEGADKQVGPDDVFTPVKGATEKVGG